jgi:hypothetical protein
MNFSDAVEIAGTQRRQSDGALIVDARTARTGIQTYAGYEVGKPEIPVVRVFRPAQEVFSTDTLASFAHRPVTNDHPSGMVNADNWKKSKVVGHSADEATAQDIYVRVPLMVSDGDMIADIGAGKRELSAGYTCDLDWTAGKNEAGEAYDAVQRNIRVNHIAIVKHGRAGETVRIGDSTPMKTLLIDNIPVALEDQASAIVEASIKRLTDSAAALTVQIAAKDTEIGRLTAELATATGKIPTADAIAQMVADRVALESRVKQIAPTIQITPTMTDAAIRRVVVKAQFPQIVTDATSDEMISGMFMTLQPGTMDTYRQPAGAHDGGMPFADNGQQGFDSYLANAWQTKQ